VRSGWHADSGRVNRRSLMCQGPSFVNPNKIAFLQKINLAPRLSKRGQGVCQKSESVFVF